MRLCIAATEASADAPVSLRFGRAPFFVTYDEDTDEFESADNSQNLNAASGAGVQSAANAIGTGATLVIAGHIGPKAMNMLQAANVKVALATEGSVRQAVKAYKDGELETNDSADRDGHW